MTERTGQRATDLAGNTQRAAVRLRDINHLDFMTTRNADKPFTGAVS